MLTNLKFFCCLSVLHPLSAACLRCGFSGASSRNYLVCETRSHSVVANQGEKSSASYYFLKNCRVGWLPSLQLLMLLKPFELTKWGFLAPFAFGCPNPQRAFTNYYQDKTESTVFQCCHKTSQSSQSKRTTFHQGSVECPADSVCLA